MASFTWNPDEVVKFTDELAREYREVVCVGIILPMMRREAPIDKGLLRQKHSVDLLRVRATGGGYIIRFRAAVPYAVVVHVGHGVIRPVRAKVLRFVVKSGKVVFTRRVGPVPGNPWMYRTFVKAGLREPRLLK